MQTSVPLPIKLVDRAPRPRQAIAISTMWRILIWTALLLVIACSSRDNATDQRRGETSVRNVSTNSEILDMRNGNRPYHLP